MDCNYKVFSSKQRYSHFNLGETYSSLFPQNDAFLTRSSTLEWIPLFSSFTARIQSLGETIFGAALLISFIQAVLALYQYRSNPRGELVFPDGLTYGIAYPTTNNSIEESRKHSTVDDDYSYNETGVELSLTNNSFMNLIRINEDDDVFVQNNRLPRVASQVIYKVNKMTVILLPLIAQKLQFILTRNSHLIHIFFIITLASVFDLWRPAHISKGDIQELSILKKLNQGQDTINLVVIGDSLAVGLGCMEKFDESKNSSVPMTRVENFSPSRKVPSHMNSTSVGPVFPDKFAERMAQKLNRSVKWRSAGVDGGTVDDINHFCTGILGEEVENGDPPDVVVVLCGINDLKISIANPIRSKFSRSFLLSMDELIRAIKVHVPNAVVVFPALPVQMFHKNSVVNILPLSVFLDLIAGYWDSLKKSVADKSTNVEYFGLGPSEILSWYRDDTGNKYFEHNLIAPDGVHPTRYCYRKWAQSISEQLCEHLLHIEQD